MLALYSAIPILLLFFLMLGIKMPSHRSAFLVLVITSILAFVGIDWLNIFPAQEMNSAGSIVLWSVSAGIIKAVFPILLIILMAIFSYNVVVESKQIEVIKNQFTSLTSDKGILVLLMVWGFGSLLEGLAGFGTAVAIPAAILIKLGFKPVFSALVSLLGNSVTSSFGSVGVGVMTLANESQAQLKTTESLAGDISISLLSELSIFFILVPFVILILTDRSKWFKNIVLAFIVGIITLGAQYFSVRHIGLEAPTIIGAVASILSLVLLAKFFFKNKNLAAKPVSQKISIAISLKSWSVYLIILSLILITGPLSPPIEKFCHSHLVSHFTIPVIHESLSFRWIGNAALWLLSGSIIGGLIQGLSLKKKDYSKY